MSHGPATEWKKEKIESFKTRLGLIMFAFYCVVYFAFIFIAVLNPKIMGADVGKINLAIAYGFGLIVIAVIQALIYNYICTKKENQEAAQNSEEGNKK